MQLLITPAELAADETLVAFDCRFSLTDKAAGRRAFEAAHIPGARFADLERDLSAAPGQGGRHPLPEREALAARLRTAGVNQDSSLICYDQNSGALAARFWWLLRWLGHADVRVLDGGFDAWLAAGLPTDRAPGNPAPGNPAPGDFQARPPLTRSCTADQLAGAALPDAKLQLLDARDAARFRGEQETIDPVAGHIPGAISVPFADNLAAGRFKSPAELRARFAALGLDPGGETVCYCGSGVTAAHNILALKLAGYPEPALYAGSWSEWITDSSRPVAKG
jgi:thiosulfate/3-mercaptopyruvate sulfurtransferase